ncbi:MAG TPA: S41 family peptidase [Acidimicrobiales bacterium]|nr:S41 family peptidase [Acidimicrobiales bacterium]
MAAETPYLRQPTIHGDRLAFVTDDDLWIGSVDGGDAWRLTADGALVRTPRLSPDGGLVAYASRAEGQWEAWVVPVDGGPARRLTWWGDATTSVLGWTADGRVVVASATGEPFPTRTWAWAVPADGSGGPSRLPLGPVTALSEADGRVVVGTDQNNHRGAAWKRYRGGTAGKAWIDRDGSGRFERFAADLDGQIEDPQLCAGRVVFVSDHEGWGNVYSLEPDGGDLRRHTDHGDAYARSLSGDGTRLAYGCVGELWLLDDLSASSRPRRLEVRLRSGRKGNRRRPLELGGALTRVAPDAAGRGAALGIRGAVVWLAHRDGPARVLAPGGAVRARTPVMLGDTAAAWVTDAEGADAIEVAPVAGGEHRRLAAGELGRVVALAASPDGRWVATAGHDGAVRLTDLESAATRVVDRSDFDIATGLTFSPDSAWLAWSQAGPYAPDERGLRQIRMVPVAGGDVVEATPMRFYDADPVFTPDGRYLAFLSARSFDPVYDELRFDLSFPAATRPYLLRLAADTPAPFDPRTDGRSVADEPPPPPKPGDAPPEVRVDLEGLAGRVVDLPVAVARMDALVATAGGLAWRRLPIAGELGESGADPHGEPSKPQLDHLDLRTGRVTTLVDAVDEARPTAGATRLVVRDGERVRVVPADRRAPDGEEGGDQVVDVDLGRVRLTIDPPAEWVQMFDEATRLIGELFWIEDMGGVDWPATVARYRPLAERVATRDELTELLWEVQGELATSHAYAMAPDAPVPPERAVGHLGADFEADGVGWRVASTVAPEPSVRAARSPLAAAGVRAGDAIVAVDGRPLDPAGGLRPLLVGTAAKVTELTVVPADGGAARRVVVRPLRDQQPLRYHAWVAGRRAETHRLSDGRVGYIHLPDMQSAGWGELFRDLRVEVRYDALVVDLRNNRGGHTSQIVFERLASKVRGWESAPGFEPATYPADTPRGPMVALIDQYAGSDGDIGSTSFRMLGLGPLVGVRTWGGVIGIDGRHTLADGGMVTQPRYAFWFYGPGWTVENHGVDPDIEVPIAPQDWGAGRDPQLETGVRAALEALEQHPPVRPPSKDDRPDRTPPALPARP